tara:strand:+ start:415 stop:873 length:459 start_codon:yes stop_codon:yes gene_type:complete
MMYRSVGVFLMLTTLAFTGCQEADPSRTIISLQIDSDGETTWIYLYTVPRVKMGNFTITFADDSETIPSVFSHQRSLTSSEISSISDSDGYFDLAVTADLKGVYWSFNCKIKISASKSDGDLFLATVTFLDDGDEETDVWELPYNMPLDYVS